MERGKNARILGQYEGGVMNIPELPHNCNSWVLVRTGTLSAVGEFYSRSNVERILRAEEGRFTALTAADYLAQLNASMK